MKKIKINTNKHLHQYKRIDLVPKYKRNAGAESYLVLKCQLPDCNHHIPLSDGIGKLCLCNICNQPMIIDKETIKKVKIRCQDCIVRKVKPELNILDEFLKDI